MKLIDGNVNSSYRVSGVELPLQTKRRLEALGLTKGSRIVILNKKRHGALVMKLRGTRFAIGKSIASNIEAEEEKDNG